MKTTKNGVFYLKDYFPNNLLDMGGEKDKKFHDDIIAFKNKYPEDLREGTKLLKSGIEKIINKHQKEINIKNIVLVAVPSSKVDKKSAVIISIRVLQKLFDNNHWEELNKIGVNLVNDGTELVRIEDVNSHMDAKRAEYQDHIDSIICNVGNLANEEGTIYIILDDITTRGFSMNACEEIMNNAGITNEIFKLAIANTVEV